jgi:hypothetical protein
MFLNSDLAHMSNFYFASQFLCSSFSPSSLFIFSTQQLGIASYFTAGDKYPLSDGHKVTHSLL